MCECHIDALGSMMDWVGETLGFSHCISLPKLETSMCIQKLGSVEDRTQSIADILNDANNYIVSHDRHVTRNLRLFVAQHIPGFLMGYQALRFPQIVDPKCLPVKSDLNTFPDAIHSSGFYVPVSTCLRLLAVSLIDDEARDTLLASEHGVKTIVSHMVDDPLNPFQRESAVFVVKVFTENYPKGQEAIGKRITV
jgi:hypothetical protein